MIIGILISWRSAVHGTERIKLNQKEITLNEDTLSLMSQLHRKSMMLNLVFWYHTLILSSLEYSSVNVSTLIFTLYSFRKVEISELQKVKKLKILLIKSKETTSGYSRSSSYGLNLEVGWPH